MQISTYSYVPMFIFNSLKHWKVVSKHFCFTINTLCKYGNGSDKMVEVKSLLAKTLPNPFIFSFLWQLFQFWSVFGYCKQPFAKENNNPQNIFVVSNLTFINREKQRNCFWNVTYKMCLSSLTNVWYYYREKHLF